MANVRKKKQVKTDANYIDNKVLTVALSAYAVEYRRCVAENLPKPKMSEEIGKAVLMIAQRLSYSPNFVNYTYIDEMMEDGIESCIKYCHNFNLEKSSNAFAYLTQIIYYSFIRRIETEKMHALIRYRAMKEAGVCGLYDAVKSKSELHDNDPQRMFIDHLQISAKDIEKYERMLGNELEGMLESSSSTIAMKRRRLKKIIGEDLGELLTSDTIVL